MGANPEVLDSSDERHHLQGKANKNIYHWTWWLLISMYNTGGLMYLFQIGCPLILNINWKSHCLHCPSSFVEDI